MNVRQRLCWPKGQTCSRRINRDGLVFDYRRIGLSRKGRLQVCRANLQAWGQRDPVTALNCLVRRTGAHQVAWLGHCAGGQMTGLLPNHPLVRA
jgi:predicted alpha/beta hydrolase